MRNLGWMLEAFLRGVWIGLVVSLIACWVAAVWRNVKKGDGA